METNKSIKITDKAYISTHSVETLSILDIQWTVVYWRSRCNLHIVCWGKVGCEWGTIRVYFGVTCVCFITRIVPVLPQGLRPTSIFLFMSKYHLKNTNKILKKKTFRFNSLRPSGAYICVSERTTIGSDNGLAPSRRQAIIWTNVEMILIQTLGTNFSEILREIYTFSVKKMHLKISSGKYRLSCLGLNVLKLKWIWRTNVD